MAPLRHDGPAFLAYDNFDVIMRWNRSEFYALSVGRLADEIAGAIETAVSEAARRGVAGKEVTPFVLSMILELTQGRSLETNIALVRNNARLAARIALARVQG